MSEPKSIEEVPSWVIVNALKCPVEAQISIVAKLLQHLDGDQRKKALSMSGVGGRSEQLPPDTITDKDHKDLMKSLYPKDKSKRFRR
jgi:hypothetical protein